MAEANKIAGVDTKGQELDNKWKEIENRIQLSKENIAESNITEAAANAKKAIELWKQDVGTESNTEKEKGQASDAFKRACFNLGIGRELYDYPTIQIKLKENEFKIEQYNGKDIVKPTFDFRLKDWKWFSQFTDAKLSYLGCKDTNGELRFTHGKYIKNDN